MNAYYPITEAISQDADTIITALNTRSEEIRNNIKSQNLFKKVSIVALKVIGLAAAVVTVASLPVAAIMFTMTPLSIAGAGVAVAITCLALCMFLDPRNAGESLVKDRWKALFVALRQGDGPSIILTCKDLAKQKQQREAAFNKCLGPLPSAEITPFFHKTSFVGYLLIAVDNLIKGHDELAKSNAHLALSHFYSSGLTEEAERLAKAITDAPAEMKRLAEPHYIGTNLHALDYLLVSLDLEASNKKG